jgi:hypothetical protein
MVEAALLHQLVVASHVDDTPVVDCDDDVGVADRGEPVSDHEARTPFIMVVSASCSFRSVRVSTLEVASSRIRIGLFARMMQAMVISCRCP